MCLVSPVFAFDRKARLQLSPSCSWYCSRSQPQSHTGQQTSCWEPRRRRRRWTVNNLSKMRASVRDSHGKFQLTPGWPLRFREYQSVWKLSFEQQLINYSRSRGNLNKFANIVFQFTTLEAAVVSTWKAKFDWKWRACLLATSLRLSLTAACSQHSLEERTIMDVALPVSPPYSHQTIRT